MSEELKQGDPIPEAEIVSSPSVEEQFEAILMGQNEALAGMSLVLLQALGRIEKLEEALFGKREA